MSYTQRDLEYWNEKIEALADQLGLDYYEQEFEIVGYNEMLAYESYVGMPSRYPHWSFGKSYEINKTLYQYNLSGLPYEMVINSNPCLAYLMKDNTFLLQILTMAHVYGHNDFFKNNRLFVQGTKAEYVIDMFKRHANIIRGYINDPSIGYEDVENTLTAAHALRFQTTRTIGIKKLTDEELKQQILKDYRKKCDRKSPLEPYVKPDPPDLSKVPLQTEDDLLNFLINYGDLEDWQKTILSIVREETAYFIPQMETKIMNEGWASFWHYKILHELGLPQDLHLEFLKRHNDVIAPRLGSINPYYVGFKIYEDLVKRFGLEKIFEVRKIERDESFLRRYLTEQLILDLNLFTYTSKGNGYFVKDIGDEEGWIEIRNNLCNTCGANQIPLIKVIDMSKKDKTLLLEHVYDGRELNLEYAENTLKHVADLWKHPIILKTSFNNKAFKLICDEKKKITRA